MTPPATARPHGCARSPRPRPRAAAARCRSAPSSSAPTAALSPRAGNRTRELADPSAHAEMLAIREACRRSGSERLTGHDLYVTLEPCPMCAAADLVRAHPPALLRRLRPEGRRRRARRPRLHAADLPPRARDLLRHRRGARPRALLKAFFADKRAVAPLEGRGAQLRPWDRPAAASRDRRAAWPSRLASGAASGLRGAA